MAAADLARTLPLCGQVAAVMPDADHAHFYDTTAQSGSGFLGQAHHTPSKYLIETAGSGVAVFEYDNDGRLDVFFANGADSQSRTEGDRARKESSADWNRLYHQKRTGPLKMLRRNPD